MSDERSIEDIIGAGYEALTPVAEDIGNTYQRVLWQDSGIRPPEASTPDMGIGLPEAADIAPLEPMTDAQLQTLVDIQNHAAEVAPEPAPTPADLDIDIG
jgi:hypothetical protein